MLLDPDQDIRLDTVTRILKEIVALYK